MKWLKNFTSTLLYIFVIMFAVIGLLEFCKKIEETPVKERINIDSIAKVNDSIKIKVESLDSIKNAKVIEITNLDNDSSIKLFYELVKE